MKTVVGKDEAVNELFGMMDSSDPCQLEHKIRVLYDFLGRLLGADRLDEKIRKKNLREQVDSENLAERVQALHRLVFPKQQWDVSEEPFIPKVLSHIEEGLADMLAKMTVEARIEKEVADRLEKNQADYMNEIKLQLINKKAGPENANTLRKYAVLEKLDQVKLSRSIMDKLRPQTVNEMVGQDRAVKSLTAKLATPFPQHVIIYGPPGVGKTTAARLVLKIAQKMKHTPFGEQAPFVEVDGTTLRWDPREIANPLLGSVHDPIYQGTKRDLAEMGVPEPKTGLVTEAHGGVLFIDEIGELDLFLQNKLLKVLEDKRVSFDSSYYDPHDPATPKYIKKLFEEGAPADFILIGATTREPEEINPALRSRCAEVFFEPLKPEDIQAIVDGGAKKLSVKLEEEVAAAISRYTIEGRKAVGLLTDAYGMALYKARETEQSEVSTITLSDLDEVIQMARLTPAVRSREGLAPETGKIFGLGVRGFLGKVLELEAVAFPARKMGAGEIRFNDTAGSMAKDSVSNAATVIRGLTGKALGDFDIHVNSIGGGNIDGPSAGAAILLVILSALESRPLRQDLAITGEISIRGRIMPVGGVQQKIYAASQAGIKTVIIPKDNEKDIPVGVRDLKIIPVEDIRQAMEIAFT